MARRLEQFPEEGPAPTRYPWDEWTDGSAWEIRQGEDYAIATENMRVNLHMRADSTGRTVRTKKISADGVEGLVFQFFDPDGDELKIKLQAMGEDAAQAAIDALYADAMNIYERARREVDIPLRDGTTRKYAPVRYRTKIVNGYHNRALVPAIASIVDSKRTSGFDRLAAAGHDDLLLERIVVDETKPYHHLFSPTTVTNARERLAELD